MQSTKISLHSFPPYRHDAPLPAIGYLKGFIKNKNPKLQIRNFYWNQILYKENFYKNYGLFGNNHHFFRAMFAYLIALQNKKKQNLDYIEKNGAMYLTDYSISRFKEIAHIFDQYFTKQIKKYKLAHDNIVGCSILFRQDLSSIYFLNKIKSINPDIIAVIGGLADKEAQVLMKMFSFIDICVLGDGEHVFYEICKKYPDIHKVSLKGIVFRENNSIITNKRDSNIQKIDRIWADYSDFDWESVCKKGQEIIIPIWDTRGCNWGKCTFCENRISAGFRERTPESIIAEIKHHLKKIPLRKKNIVQILFLAENVRGNSNARLIKLLDSLIMLKRSYPTLTIFVSLSPLYTDEKTMKLLNKLEARVQWGFEQWSDVLKKMNKPHRIEHGIYTLKLVEKYSKMKIISLNLLIGFPGETLEDVYDTVSNLWKIRFIIGNLLKEKRLDSMVPTNVWINRMSKLGKKWDYENNLMKEYLANNPLTKFLSVISGNQQLAAEFTEVNERIFVFDINSTIVAQKHLIFGIQLKFENVKIAKAYQVKNKIILNVHEDIEEIYQIELDDIDIKIFYLTKKIISHKKLLVALNEYPKKKIDRSIKNLQNENLLFLNSNKYINTLPANVQDKIDIFCETAAPVGKSI